MSKAQKDAVKSMKPSAYRSMLMGKLGMTKSSPKKKKDLLITKTVVAILKKVERKSQVMKKNMKNI